jgi:hypothetical protein
MEAGVEDISISPKASSRHTRVEIDLALQGGGAHGAFTWGVLDRLLEEDWLRIDGISGTSAGAVNAVVLASGYAASGPRAAREALQSFWRRVSDAAQFSPFQRTPLDRILGRWTLDTSPVFLAFDLAARIFSPYDLNPFGTNPLEDILRESVDFRRIRASPAFRDGNECQDGAGPRLQKCGNYARSALGLRMFADAVPGGRSRRRTLLGRRLFGESHPDAAGPRMHLARHDPGTDQPG